MNILFCLISRWSWIGIEWTCHSVQFSICCIYQQPQFKNPKSIGILSLVSSIARVASKRNLSSSRVTKNVILKLKGGSKMHSHHCQFSGLIMHIHLGLSRDWCQSWNICQGIVLALQLMDGDMMERRWHLFRPKKNCSQRTKTANIDPQIIDVHMWAGLNIDHMYLCRGKRQHWLFLMLFPVYPAHSGYIWIFFLFTSVKLTFNHYPASGCYHLSFNSFWIHILKTIWWLSLSSSRNIPMVERCFLTPN